MANRKYLDDAGLQYFITLNNNNYAKKITTINDYGGIKIGYTTNATNRTYAVQLDTNGKAFVNIPWTEGRIYTAGDNISISADNVISSTASGGVEVITTIPSLTEGDLNKLYKIDNKLYQVNTYVDEPNLDNMTWDEIIDCANKHMFDSSVLGYIKQLDIGGVAYTAQIVGVNHDDLTDGTGKANLTFQLKYLLATYYAMNATNTNSGGWEATAMRTNVLPNILSQMPTNIQNAIKSVNKANCKVYNSSTITYTSDKLFLLSEAEVFGVKTQAAALEGTQYEYWANNNTAAARIKYQGEGGTSANYWWLRSPRWSSGSYFCYVHTSGSIDGNNASRTYGVSLAFDI